MQPQPNPAARELPSGAKLSWILALAYLLTIVYASLQPLRDWRFPSAEILRFLTAPWPRYITLDDLLINVIAYVPLGFLFSHCFRPRLTPAAAAAAALALSAAVSVSMESIQMFLPARIASNVDVLTNSLGALLGAMAASLFSPTWFPGRKLAELRRTWCETGTTADVGLLMVCLWLITQAHPTAQLFGTGYLRSTFALPPFFMHTPQLLLLAEASVALLNLAGLGLLVSVLSRESSRRNQFIALVVVAGIVIKSLTLTALLKSPGPLGWLTPGVASGLIGGALLLALLIRLSAFARMILAALCICGAVAAINLAPDNPYQTIPPQLLTGAPSHFLSFSGIIRALSELWPFLVVAYLAFAAASSPSHNGP